MVVVKKEKEVFVKVHRGRKQVRLTWGKGITKINVRSKEKGNIAERWLNAIEK